MSHHVIQKLTDFNFIFNDEIKLFGNTDFIQEEIYNNMWIIDIGNEFTKKITLQDLTNFLTNLIQNRSQQIQEKYPALKATFYIWYDPQSVQLRFNIISGENTRPPFGCSINILESPLTILKTFLTDVQKDPHPLSWENITILNPGDPGFDDDDDDDDKDWIQDVYITTLPQPTFHVRRNFM